MNTKLCRVLLSLGVAVAFMVISACVNPLGGLPGAASKTTITLHMKATSPTMSGLLQRLSMKKLATSRTSGRRVGALASKAPAPRSSQSAKFMAGRPKAYLGADTIGFTLLNSANQQVTAWGYGAGANAYTQSIASGGFDISLLVPEQSVPAGTYTLRADIYNTQVSAGIPMVSGAVSVTVTPNQTTAVTISCLPVSPQALEVGGGTANAALVPWWLYVGEESGVYTVGGECWYQVHLDAGVTYQGAAGTDSVGYDAYAALFDSSGALVAVGGGTNYNDGMPLVYYAETSGTYYVGVFPFSTSTGASTVQTYFSLEIWPPIPELYFDGVYSSTLSSQEVELSWSGPSSDSGIVFSVLRSADPTFATSTDVTGNGDLSYGDEGGWLFYESSAPYGQTLYYKVIATDPDLGVQAGSNVVTAPAPPPANLEAFWASDEVTATWDAVNGASEYYCELWVDGVYQSYDYTDGTSVSWGDLSGTHFQVLVQAHIESGYGYYSISDEVGTGPQ